MLTVLGDELLLIHLAVPSKLCGVFARHRPVLYNKLWTLIARYSLEIAKCVGLIANPVYLDVITRRVT